jgi:hypothetical protein
VGVGFVSGVCVLLGVMVWGEGFSVNSTLLMAGPARAGCMDSVERMALASKVRLNIDISQ